MRITRRQLRQIIREAIDPREMEEPLGGWVGDALHNDPDYAHHTDTDTTPQKLKLADLVRAVDFESDGRGGDFQPVVGKQVGTVIEIDEDPDYPTQYTVLFPDGTTIMDSLGPPDEQRFKLVNENKMKVTKRQLKRIIREAIDIVNQDTGEVIDFGEDSLTGIPDQAVPDLVKRLGLNVSPNDALSNDDWQKLADETMGKQEDREVKRRVDKMKADSARLNVDSLLTRLSNWAHDAFKDYAGDNPGTDVQDVAYDLADAAEYEFEADEWEELLWHFDGNVEDLKVYSVESMG